MTARQHRESRKNLFGTVPLSGQNPAAEKTASPNYSAELMAPSAPVQNHPTAPSVPAIPESAQRSTEPSRTYGRERRKDI